MISKAKTIMGYGKPKNQHSLDNLKYLFGTLNKNQTVTESNKDLLIETLRSISEILIWGDQNDSSVFDFFLEKQMIRYFLYYMEQKYGRFICVQLLQTLNILFENIRNETSLYFLLSNNHINNIILHKFDFSDEEVMAYYISFLKTLSLKLNSHSIHFFFNERASEFPLYVEAIKFFDHPEAMVRIAVRTLTLNVYKVSVQSMQRFVKEKTALHYFSNLVWLMRNQVLDLDIFVKNTVDHTKKSRLTDLIDEHIDHLNYLQDIYIINNQGISNYLSEQLIRRMFVPVYLCSLLKKDRFVIKDRKPYIQPSVALFLLSHVFSVITYEPLLNDLCELIYSINDESVLDQMCTSNSSSTEIIDYLIEPKSLVNCLSTISLSGNKTQPSQLLSRTRSKSVPQFNTIELNDANSSLTTKPSKTIKNFSDLEESLEESNTNDLTIEEKNENELEDEDDEKSNMSNIKLPTFSLNNDLETKSLLVTEMNQLSLDMKETKPIQNITDDEKYRKTNGTDNKSLNYRIIYDALIQHLNTQDYNELNCLLSLSFFYTLVNNPGTPLKFLEKLKLKNIESKSSYSEVLLNKLVGVISKSIEPEFKVRLATLEISIKLIKTIGIHNNCSYLSDFQLACIDQAKEQSAYILRRQFKTEEMFLDMFEHEYQNLNTTSHTFNVEMLLRDWSVLLPPTTTPLSGIELMRRFPCGDTEKLKQSIRIFFLLRNLYLTLTNQTETLLPLTKQEHLVKENDALDLNSSDLIACTVNLKEKKDRRFLVIDPIQFILVEPEVKRIGWGIVKFSDLIQDVEVTPDKEDSRSLNISIKKSPSISNGKPYIILNSVFTFDDHIRCMAAKQHLVRARDRARRMKLEKIAQLLDIVSNSNNNNNTFNNNNNNNNSNNSSSTNTAKNFITASPSSDVLSYNLVAGRASMISQTWSQITNNEKRNSISGLPITALTSPSLNKTQAFYKNNVGLPYGLSVSSNANQLTTSSITNINSHDNEKNLPYSNDLASLSDDKDDVFSLNKLKENNNNNNLDSFNNYLSELPEKSRSSINYELQQVLAKTLITSTDQPITLISEAESLVSSKIQILPPVGQTGVNSVSKQNLSQSKEFTT